MSAAKTKKTNKPSQARPKFYVKASAAIVKRHQKEVERLQAVIADHAAKFETETSIAKRGHHLASKRFRELDTERSQKIIVLYQSVDSIDAYRDASYDLEIVQSEYDIASAYVHRDMYQWMAEEYDKISNAGRALQCRIAVERADLNAAAVIESATARMKASQVAKSLRERGNA
jgi:hypothetical protein